MEVKRKMKSIVILVVVVLVVGVFGLIPRDKPEPIPEASTTPTNQTDSTKPDVPADPKPIRLEKTLISFSQPGKAEVNPINDLAVDILCEMPDQTQVISGMDIIVRDPKWNASDKPQKEESLLIDVGVWRITLLGVNPTAEFKDQLGKIHVAETGINYIKIPAGTVIGTVGHPLKNDWGEGTNLVIAIEVRLEYVDALAPAVASILESLR
jgi:hypothetical protein